MKPFATGWDAVTFMNERWIYKMKRFYFIGGPKEGYADAFFTRLGRGWWISPGLGDLSTHLKGRECAAFNQSRFSGGNQRPSLPF
jgi:hypothetical protein